MKEAKPSAAQVSDTQASDHRGRTAELRREQMRRRLIEGAILVFAEHGVSSALIGQVIATAEVSRGTFYNYFRTNEDLSDAVCLELAGELIAHAEMSIANEISPERAVALGTNTVLLTALRYPVLGRFMGSLAMSGETLMREMSVKLGEQLATGMERGVFHRADIGMISDVILGTLRTAMLRVALGMTAPLSPDLYIREIVSSLLRALGIDAAEAARLSSIDIPAPDLPFISIIARAQARFDVSQQNKDA